MPEPVTTTLGLLKAAQTDPTGLAKAVYLKAARKTFKDLIKPVLDSVNITITEKEVDKFLKFFLKLKIDPNEINPSGPFLIFKNHPENQKLAINFLIEIRPDIADKVLNMIIDQNTYDAFFLEINRLNKDIIEKLPKTPDNKQIVINNLATLMEYKEELDNFNMEDLQNSLQTQVKKKIKEFENKLTPQKSIELFNDFNKYVSELKEGKGQQIIEQKKQELSNEKDSQKRVKLRQEIAGLKHKMSTEKGIKGGRKTKKKKHRGKLKTRKKKHRGKLKARKRKIKKYRRKKYKTKKRR